MYRQDVVAFSGVLRRTMALGIPKSIAFDVLRKTLCIFASSVYELLNLFILYAVRNMRCDDLNDFADAEDCRRDCESAAKTFRP